MLTIQIEAAEAFDEANNTFLEIPAIRLEFEHSLVSVSKWEELHKKPFLSKKEKTTEETLSYLECMCLTPDVESTAFLGLSEESMGKIGAYVEGSHTATTFSEDLPKTPQREEVITSEIIYYWMVALQIPMDAEVWPLSRLLALIRVVNIKNQPKKKQTKLSPGELAARNRQLNEQRKKQYNTTG